MTRTKKRCGRLYAVVKATSAFGEAHLRHLVGEFVAHYNGERYHQGLGGKLVVPGNDNGEVGAIKTRSRLGGSLNFYHREAA